MTLSKLFIYLYNSPSFKGLNDSLQGSVGLRNTNLDVIINLLSETDLPSL